MIQAWRGGCGEALTAAVAMQLMGSMLIVTVLTLASMGAGWLKVQDQHRQLSTYQPIQAMVAHAEVRWLGRGKYTAAIEYRYRVNNQEYTTNRLAPLLPRGDKDWAEKVVKDHGEGSFVSAYVNPADPAKAYLLRQARYWPYGLVLLPLVLVGAYLKPLAAGGFFQRQPSATLTERGGWYRIEANSDAATRMWVAAAAALLWYGYGVFSFMLYRQTLRLVGGSPEPLAIVSAAVYGVLGLIPVWLAVRCLRHHSRFGRAEVLSTLAEPHADKPIIVRVQQPVTGRALVAQMTGSLVCDQRRGLHSQRLFSNSFTFAQNQQLHRNQVLADELTFEVPPKKQRPSSACNRWQYPRIDWQVELLIRLHRGPQYRTTFPIHVLPPAPSTGD